MGVLTESFTDLVVLSIELVVVIVLITFIFGFLNGLTNRIGAGK